MTMIYLFQYFPWGRKKTDDAWTRYCLTVGPDKHNIKNKFLLKIFDKQK